MAQVPRAVPVPVTPALHTARASAAVRPTASEPKPVEQLAPEVETRFESDQYYLVATPSKLFADIFVGDLEVGSAGGRGSGSADVQGYTNVVSKAISTYETNAKVISGSVEERGAQLSFLL